MKKILAVGFIFVLSIVFAANTGLAASKKRDRKRDGTCRSTISIQSEDFTLAASKKRSRKKEGSCQSYLRAEDDSLTIAADRKRDRKRDGTCRS